MPTLTSGIKLTGQLGCFSTQRQARSLPGSGGLLSQLRQPFPFPVFISVFDFPRGLCYFQNIQMVLFPSEFNPWLSHHETV